VVRYMCWGPINRQPHAYTPPAAVYNFHITRPITSPEFPPAQVSTNETGTTDVERSRRVGYSNTATSSNNAFWTDGRCESLTLGLASVAYYRAV
jgi:hypothetical protein